MKAWALAFSGLLFAPAAGLQSGAVRAPSWQLTEVRSKDLGRPLSFERIRDVLAERASDLGPEDQDRVADAIAEEAEDAGIDPFLVLAVISVESGFQDRSVSSMDARGLMQLRPGTLSFMIEREGEQLSPEQAGADPALRVRLGVRYLALLRKQFGTLDHALMAYNGGPTRLYLAAQKRELDPLIGYVRLVRRRHQELAAEFDSHPELVLGSG